MNKKNILDQDLQKKNKLILEISTLLMQSGANSSRVNDTIQRFSKVLNCTSHSFVSHKSIVSTLSSNEDNSSITKVENVGGLQINFKIISKISKASWTALENNWTFDRISQELEKIKTTVRYSRIVVLIAVSLAGAGFCKIFHGDYWNMLVAFLVTFCGLFVLQSSHKKGFNHYIGIFLAAFTASFLALIAKHFAIGANPDAAIATSVLFLIPGVALINSFLDLLDNRFLIGVARFVHGIIIILAITIGLFTALSISKWVL